MKSEMPFYGVRGPEQRRIWRQVFLDYPLATFAEWQGAALELWRGAAFREERYAAFELTDLRKYALFRTFAAVPMFEEMIADWSLVGSCGRGCHTLPRRRLASRAAQDETPHAALGEGRGHVETPRGHPLSDSVQG